jgi:DNA-binding MarR family transcriptional regulator
MTSDREKDGDAEVPDRVDHVGVDLWRAFRAYERAMFERVVKDGFEDITVADSDVLVFVGPKGANLNEIARRRGVTKQAVHEQVHGLVERGYLALEVDPKDRRARIARHTNKGRRLTKALREVKNTLHREVAATLGDERLDTLRAMLKQIEAKFG